jgi:hypothetical protein
MQSVLLWLRGTYSSYTDYDLDIVGMFDPKPLCDFRRSVSYLLDSDDNCIINLVDLQAFAAEWLDCGLAPAEACAQ